jgi:glycosyltransferase involved in cell wall biosynthesis
MQQKKIKLLFVIESLTISGSEKSLITLLSNIDPDLYEIDLQLFRYGGELDKNVPNYVNLLDCLAFVQYSSESWKHNIKAVFSKNKISYFIAKLNYSLRLRFRKRGVSEISKLYWESVSHLLEKTDKEYDFAIAFAQGAPTYYVKDIIKAKRKIAWVNANMVIKNQNKKFQEKYYNDFDKIVAISEGAKNHLINILPQFSHKYLIIPNIIDFKSIPKMAELYEAPIKTNTFNILTVGRLDNRMKGMDITIEACKILKEKGIDFHWFIIGNGEFKGVMETFINKYNLNGHLNLLGAINNPYPYFKKADLYVQTSRSEGYGRTIAEARMLNLPIVTTNFDTVGLQIEHLKNGVITEINPEAVADGIIKIMNDKELYNSIVEYLKREPKENTETVKRFDAMISNLLTTN